MSSFIKAIAILLQDRQTLKIEGKKIKDDLLLTVIPTKGKIHNITIPQADLEDPELDGKIMGLINAPVENATFQATATDAPDKNEEEEEKSEKEEDKKPSSAKKVPAKAAAKPATGKKSAPAKRGKKAEEPVVDPVHEKELNDALQTEPEEMISLQGDMEAKPGPMLTEGEQPAGVQSEPISLEQAGANAEAVAQTVEALEEASGVSIASPAATQDDDNKALFNVFIEEGNKHFANRSYSDARDSFASALELFPEDQEAIKLHKKADQWLRAVERIKTA